jgi:hypothetical protein
MRFMGENQLKLASMFRVPTQLQYALFGLLFALGLIAVIVFSSGSSEIFIYNNF